MLTQLSLFFSSQSPVRKMPGAPGPFCLGSGIVVVVVVVIVVVVVVVVCRAITKMQSLPRSLKTNLLCGGRW